jgi:hypothetical protein
MLSFMILNSTIRTTERMFLSVYDIYAIDEVINQNKNN